MDNPALRALAVIERRAETARDANLVRICAVLGSEPSKATVAAFVKGATLARWSSSVRQSARLTLNFHPDRISKHGSSVAEGMLRTGRYRPQVETGISSGGRSAVPDGERTMWEQDLFGDAYRPGGAVRPVYGALDLTRDHHGGSPRFGSCFVVLDRACLDRSTFCVGDSHKNPTDVGTLTQFHPIAAGLLEQGARRSGLDRDRGGGAARCRRRRIPIRPWVARGLRDPCRRGR